MQVFLKLTRNADTTADKRQRIVISGPIFPLANLYAWQREREREREVHLPSRVRIREREREREIP